MKVTVEIDCTPQEARDFLGLPDVSEANAVYVEAITKAMRGVTSFEQMQDYAKQLAPMGQMGLKLFQSAIEKGAGAAMAGFGGAARRKKPADKD